jgi:hypothetical protein
VIVFLKVPYVLIHVTLLALVGQLVVSLLLRAARSRSLSRGDLTLSEEGSGVWTGYGATGHDTEEEKETRVRCAGCRAILEAAR